MRVTFLTVMPSPYVQDLFAAMSVDSRVDLRVLYLEQEAPDTYWGEQQMPKYAEVLPGRWLGISGARVHYNPTVKKRLAELDSDLVIVVGYIGLTNQIAMRSLTRSGKKWAFWGEIPGLHDRGVVGRWVRKQIQKPLQRAKGVAAVGSHAVAAYQELLGDSADRIFRNIPYHCSISQFQQAGAERNSSAGCRFLYCGQLIERKGVDLLCTAFIRLASTHSDVSLTFAGEGPLRETLVKSVPNELSERVKFPGFQDVDDLPQIFAGHDVFLLPSRHDGWGVVVNQAVASAMPVIATDTVGAANDLVIDGENGFRIEAGSADSIYEAMKNFVDDPSLSRQMGLASRRMSESIQLDHAVNDWVEFFEASLRRTP